MAVVTAKPGIPGLRIAGIIGEGGFATVYRGWQAAIGREVAVKVDSRVLLSDRDRRRFVREVNAAGRLSGHPNVVDIYDAGTLHDGHPYMVMEFCPGGSLADAVRGNGMMNPAQVRDIGIKIADALAAAHAAGVLHRDVKPANILVNRYGVVCLSDFGLASIVAPGEEQSVTREALTPAYASPERFQGREPTAACDLYSLAATLYALLTGRPPRFPADGGRLSVATIVSLHGESVDDIPGVPSALMATLRRTLAVDPALRPRSAEELRDELIAAPASEPRPGPRHKPRTAAMPMPVRAAGKPTRRSTPPAGIARHARERLSTRATRTDAVGSRRLPKARLAPLAVASIVIIAATAILATRALSPDTRNSASAPAASALGPVGACSAAPSSAAGTTSKPAGVTGSLSLRKGGQVSYQQPVSGVVTGRPPEAEVWIVVTPMGAPACWPQPGPLSLGRAGHFQTTVNFGLSAAQDSGDKFTVRLVIASRAASARFNAFLDPPVPSKGLPALPSGVQVLATVEVTRN